MVLERGADRTAGLPLKRPRRICSELAAHRTRASTRRALGRDGRACALPRTGAPTASRPGARLARQASVRSGRELTSRFTKTEKSHAACRRAIRQRVIPRDPVAQREPRFRSMTSISAGASRALLSAETEDRGDVRGSAPNWRRTTASPGSCIAGCRAHPERWRIAAVHTQKPQRLRRRRSSPRRLAPPCARSVCRHCDSPARAGREDKSSRADPRPRTLGSGRKEKPGAGGAGACFPLEGSVRPTPPK